MALAHLPCLLPRLLRDAAHPVEDNVDFRTFVVIIENILADSIVAGVCCIGTQYGVFSYMPGERKCCPPASARYGVFHGWPLSVS
jgi:hypothetical protein